MKVITQAIPVTLEAKFDQFVATLNGNMIGTLQGQIEEPTGPEQVPVYVLTRFFVSQPERGKGAGTALLSHAATLGAMNCQRLALSCEWSRGNALKFYFSRGFEFCEDMGTHANLVGDVQRVKEACEAYLASRA